MLSETEMAWADYIRHHRDEPVPTPAELATASSTRPALDDTPDIAELHEASEVGAENAQQAYGLHSHGAASVEEDGGQ